MFFKIKDLNKISIYRYFYHENTIVIELNDIVDWNFICIDLKLFAKDITNKIIVEKSLDGKKYLQICEGMYEKDKVIIDPNISISSKFVKIIFSDILEFELSNIDVYNKKYNLVIAGLQSGWGDRLLAMMHSLYIANQTSCKFGFVWYENKHQNYNFKCEDKDNKISLLEIESEEYVFNSEFLDEFSYTKLIPYCPHWNLYPKNHICDYEYDTEYYWGSYITHHSQEDRIKDIAPLYLKEYPAIWKRIKFSNNVEQLFLMANKRLTELKISNFCLIHIRSGMAVYNDFWSNSQSSILWNKEVTVEIAIELLKIAILQNRDIVICGEDAKELLELKKYSMLKFNKSHVKIFTIHEIINFDNINETQRAILDLGVMLNASHFISGESGFVKIASYATLGQEPQRWNLIFSNDECCEIMKKNLDEIYINKAHKFYSLINYYRFLYIKSKNYYELYEILINAVNFAKNNAFCLIALLDCCLNLKYFDEAEKNAEQIYSIKESFFGEYLSAFPKFFIDDFILNVSKNYNEVDYNFIYLKIIMSLLLNNH
ncbi:hypothetical protein, partial [Campylobacter insulaenigrae]